MEAHKKIEVPVHLIKGIENGNYVENGNYIIPIQKPINGIGGIFFVAVKYSLFKQPN